MEEWSGEPRREEEPDPAGGAQDAPPLMEPEFVSGSVPPPPAPYRPMARRRLALLTAAAVVLGVLAGAGLGYKIQQDRAPTPLPKLIGPPPTQPAAPGPVPSSARPAHDRNAVYEADLLKLLMPTPKGAKETERDRLELADLAEFYNEPSYMYKELSKNGFRRAAVADWETGRPGNRVTTEVSLTQFRDEERAYTSAWIRNLEDPGDVHRTYGDALPGHRDSVVMPSAVPYDEGDGIRIYVGEAFARVGNIGVQVYVTSRHPVTAKMLTPVITKQLERL